MQLGAHAGYKGLRPNFTCQVGFFYSLVDFYLLFSLFLIDFLHFWEILGIFGAQILGGSWR
jgi:hypothetical protein